MYSLKTFVIALVALASSSADAFTTSKVSCLTTSPASTRQSHSTTTTTTTVALSMAVKDITNEGDFDKTVKSAGSNLVVVDYSTTWCGPCKVIAPKFEELSETYGKQGAVFLKVIGDASPEASKLMKREGVRSVPSFHYFVNGEKIDVVNGANAEAIEAAITKHIHSAV